MGRRQGSLSPRRRRSRKNGKGAFPGAQPPEDETNLKIYEEIPISLLEFLKQENPWFPDPPPWFPRSRFHDEGPQLDPGKELILQEKSRWGACKRRRPPCRRLRWDGTPRRQCKMTPEH